MLMHFDWKLPRPHDLKSHYLYVKRIIDPEAPMIHFRVYCTEGPQALTSSHYMDLCKDLRADEDCVAFFADSLVQLFCRRVFLGLPY